MGKTTGIAWADSTWNPWIGCTKVSPGCDHCYAEALDARYQWGGAAHWGPGVPRHRTSESYWKQPRKWDSIAHFRRRTWRVFPSLCDPFDNEVPDEWRADFWKLIHQTPNLTWLLLTKRVGNVAKMLPGLMNGHWPIENVWLGASIVNQEEADRDLPKLLRVSGVAKLFVSYEPALGPVDFAKIPRNDPEHPHPEHYDIADIDWIIVGGESNQGGTSRMSHSMQGARPFNLDWARSTVKQCRAAGVAVFVKQIGSNPKQQGFTGYPRMQDRAGAEPLDWPADIRVQEFPA